MLHMNWISLNGALATACALCLLACSSGSPLSESELPSATGAGGSVPVPTTPTLEPGWTEFLPGGDTICSRGTEFAYFVRPGTVNKVIVDFIGGGACWNSTTCSVADAIFNADVENIREAIAADDPRGFYEDRPDNPFRDWYHVIVPYCTGDVHWGDNIATYGEGENAFTINHKGAVNTRTVLGWVYDNFSAPEQILVTGCSAGSYGSAMWAPHIMNHYPDTHVIQFGDSGAGVITQSFFEESFPSWNAEPTFPDWIDAFDLDRVNLLDLELADLYVGTANHYPQNIMSQYNSAFDDNQVFYFQAMGGGSAQDWSQQMFASIDEIEGRADTFVSFIPSGEQHCILGFDNFYSVNVGDEKLVDWLSDLVDDKSVGSYACSDDCSAPTP